MNTNRVAQYRDTHYVVMDGSGDVITCLTLLRAAHWLLRCEAGSVVMHNGQVVMRRVPGTGDATIAAKYGEAANDVV